MLMRQPVSEPGEIWWVFLDGYKWLCPRRPNWFSNIKVMSTYIWLAWMQSWETCTQKWPVICGCNWTPQLEKSIPFFIPLFGMLENAFQTLLSEPLTAFIPSKTPCQKQITFPDLEFVSVLAITPVRTGEQWPQDGLPVGPGAQSLGSASPQPRSTPSSACGRWRRSRTWGPPALALPSSASPLAPPQPPCSGGPEKHI